MKNYFELREKFRKPKPPFKAMHITGFEEIGRAHV